VIINVARGSVVDETDRIEPQNRATIWRGLEVRQRANGADELRTMQKWCWMPHIGSGIGG